MENGSDTGSTSKYLIASALVLFFVAGFVVGVLVGGHIQQGLWEEYIEDVGCVPDQDNFIYKYNFTGGDIYDKTFRDS